MNDFEHFAIGECHAIIAGTVIKGDLDQKGTTRTMQLGKKETEALTCSGNMNATGRTMIGGERDESSV